MAQRLLVDMDGTLAKFHDEVNYLERMFEKDFFCNLKPFENMVTGIRQFLKNHPDIEVYIVSAKVPGDSTYCEDEKNVWLDYHLPEIDHAHRIYTEVGHSKAEYLPGGVTKDDYLLDDYNRGLNLFLFDGGSVIKCHNNINQKGLGAYGGSAGRMWAGSMVHTEDKPEMIAAELAQHMGLEIDLGKVISAYKEISYYEISPGVPLQPYDKSFQKHLTRTNTGKYESMEVSGSNWSRRDIKGFTNPLNAIRYLYGKNSYREYTLHPLEGPAFSITAHRLQDICSNLGVVSDFKDYLQPEPNRFASEIKKVLEDSRKAVVGQINYLHTDGTVGYDRLYHSVSEMKDELAYCENHGIPITSNWFVKEKTQSFHDIRSFFTLADLLHSEYNFSIAEAADIAHALLTPYGKRTEVQMRHLEEAWHNAEFPGFPGTLRDFLRASESEYQGYLKKKYPDPNHQRNRPLSAMISHAESKKAEESINQDGNSPSR